MKSDPHIESAVDFAAAIERLAVEITAALKFDEKPQSVMSPKVIAVCLLARAISNFRAGVLLLRHGQIVEGRIIARCCYENLFSAIALAEQKDEYIARLDADDKASRKSRGEFLLKISTGPREDDRELKAFLNELGKGQLKRKTLTPKEVAMSGTLPQAYAYYAQMSVDAAHPTIASLVGRYTDAKLRRSGEIVIVGPEPVIDQAEAKDAWVHLSEALLGVCVYLAPLLGGEEIADMIGPILEKRTDFANLIASKE